MKAKECKCNDDLSSFCEMVEKKDKKKRIQRKTVLEIEELRMIISMLEDPLDITAERLGVEYAHSDLAIRIRQRSVPVLLEL